MHTEAPSTVIGVFRDHALAEQAYEELQNSSWQPEQIKLIRQHSEGILSAFKQNFDAKNGQTDADISLLDNLDLPDEQRQAYQREFDAGSTLMLVQTQDHSLHSRDIMHRYGAYNVFVPIVPGGERIVPLRKEQLNIQTQWVEVGEIRVRKRVITEQRTFTVPVTREEVTIERLPGQGTPVSGHSTSRYILNEDSTLNEQPSEHPASIATSHEGSTLNEQSASGDTDTAEILRDEGMIRIIVHEEQVVIDKRPVVVEEIIIRKKVQQENVQRVESVKHEEVELEQSGNIPVHSSNEENSSEAASNR